ncbi:DHA2 family efflux MFS transporter permease subunit [Protofrankia symbiont of Coriaria ruscifolia]|uniref:DHA2 family efflux MFS transporter permease subunit n=1 Tax=Protofrankia symbiont of Coriaria ruscifolia TaxID=1306542 RepID=UPI0010417EFA|nr:DHA2 family efflux MFS transporter permease subunit [Protofrankia symbiont of Coriaria ruscifolia]
MNLDDTLDRSKSPPSAPARTAAPAAAQTQLPGDDRLDPAFLRMAVVLLLAMLVALLDETIVNVGIDTLTRSLDSPLSTIQWVTAGYLLAVSVAIPLSGWAIDRFGGKNTWLTAVGLFTLGSTLCGAAWSAESLIGFRVVQGFGGGMIIPVVQTVLARNAGPGRVGRAMGLIAIPLTVGPVLGPILGGLFVDSLSWRWMFLVNLPVGVVAIVLALRAIPTDRPEQAGAQALDRTGLVLLSPGFAALVYALSTAGHRGDFAATPVLVSAASGLVLIAGYAGHALTTRAQPLIDLRLFANRGFTAAVGVMFLVGAVAITLLFLTPLYYQQIHGTDALRAGLLLAPQGLLGAIGTIAVGKLAGGLSARTTSTVGMLLAALGMFAFTRAGATTSQAWLVVAVSLGGFGLGFTIAPTMASMYEAVGPDGAARATGALFIFNHLGGSIGIAVVATALQRGAAGNAASSTTLSAATFADAYWWPVVFATAAAVAAAAIPLRWRASRPVPVPESGT